MNCKEIAERARVCNEAAFWRDKFYSLLNISTEQELFLGARPTSRLWSNEENHLWVEIPITPSDLRLVEKKVIERLRADHIRLDIDLPEWLATDTGEQQ